jgi:acetate kinase
VLNKNSGLKGISQISGDMKTIIEKMETGNVKEQQLCKLAFAMFIQHLRSGICAMRSSLKKLDTLVFTAGIGEHSPLVRQLACDDLDFLGLQIDKLTNQNATSDKNIASSKSETAILVIKAREDWQIAKECLTCIMQSALKTG